MSLSKNLKRRIIPVIPLAFLFAIPVLAQDPITQVLLNGMPDTAALKRNAEAGNAAAQVSFGNLLSSRYRQLEALGWYRKAAAQGNIDAEYHIGQMLLFGGYGDPANLVKPNKAEGLRWTFMAATNLHTGACHNMIKAVGQGLGTSPDPLAAYAWLVVYSETPNSAMVSRFEMNEMALRMTTEDIRRGRAIAAEWKSGHWQRPVIQVIPDGDARLKVTGIATGMKHPFAVINGKTLSPGDSVAIDLKPETVRLKCLKIEDNSVAVLIEGEDQPRVLHPLH